MTQKEAPGAGGLPADQAFETPASGALATTPEDALHETVKELQLRVTELEDQKKLERLTMYAQDQTHRTIRLSFGTVIASVGLIVLGQIYQSVGQNVAGYMSAVSILLVAVISLTTILRFGWTRHVYNDRGQLISIERFDLNFFQRLFGRFKSEDDE